MPMIMDWEERNKQFEKNFSLLVGKIETKECYTPYHLLCEGRDSLRENDFRRTRFRRKIEKERKIEIQKRKRYKIE